MDTAPPLPTGMDYAPNERTALREMLDYYRAVFQRKMHGLDAAQLSQTLPPSSLTLGGLLFHMAVVEDGWFDDKFAANEPIDLWKNAPWDEDHDWELNHARDFAPEFLMATFDEAVSRSRAIEAAAASLDATAARTHPSGAAWNMRWIMVHMIEEYARHCGHADFLREAIDGATGD